MHTANTLDQTSKPRHNSKSRTPQRFKLPSQLQKYQMVNNPISTTNKLVKSFRGDTTPRLRSKRLINQNNENDEFLEKGSGEDHRIFNIEIKDS
jgi:hypothetical protein